VTLWVIAILSVLSVAIARYLSFEARVTKYAMLRNRARAMARSGVYLAMARLALDRDRGEADGKSYDWLTDDWAYFADSDEVDPSTWIIPVPSPGQDEAGASQRIEIRINDEERKLPLNTEDARLEQWLAELLRQAAAPQAAVLAKTIVDYRDPPEDGEDDPGGRPPYFAKNAAFSASEELNDVLGMTPGLYAELRPYVSVHTVSPSPDRLNINTVERNVLVALGLSEGAADAIVSCREGRVFDDPATIFATAEICFAGNPIDEDDRAVLMNDFGVASQQFTVVSEGVVDGPPGVRVRVEAVVRRDEACAQIPACIVAWREG
jgi:type II secretory pathway component PulK